MKYLSLIFMSIFLVLSGCTQDSPVALDRQEGPMIMEEPVLDASCFNRKRVKRLPFFAGFKETWETLKPPVFPDDPIGEIEIIGTGFASHMGRSKIYIHEYINFGVYPSEIVGDYLSITSNRTGDKIEGTVTGLGYPGEEGRTTFEGTFYITGGTGRFEGASGEAQFEGAGVADLATGTGSGWVKFRGYILINKRPLS